jgi:hypothetical protein
MEIYCSLWRSDTCACKEANVTNKLDFIFHIKPKTCRNCTLYFLRLPEAFGDKNISTTKTDPPKQLQPSTTIKKGRTRTRTGVSRTSDEIKI